MIEISYAEKRILKYLLDHEEATKAELHRISHNRVEPVKKLLDRKFIYRKENGKYATLISEFDGIYKEFLIDVCLVYFCKHPQEVLNEGITQKVYETYRELMPSFRKVLQENKKKP
jgi:hypothetical protein